MPISKLLQLALTDIRFRIALPIATFLAISVIGSQIYGHSRPMYSAQARIWVQVRHSFVKEEAPAPGESPPSPLLDAGNGSGLINICEIIQSDAVMKLAHEELEQKLKGKPVPSVEEISCVRAVPIKDASIIKIEYTSADPEISTAVVDSVVNALFKENTIQAAGPLEETKSRLERELELAKQEYNNAKEQMKSFQNANESIDLEEETRGLTAARDDLEHEMTETDHDLDALNVKVQFVQKQLGFGPEDVLAVEKLNSDEEVHTLKHTIADTEVKLIELRSKFQEEHPRVKRLKAILADAKKELADRYSALIGRVESKFDGMSGENEVQQKLLDDMVTAKSDIVTLESKKQSLVSYHKEIDAQLQQVPDKQITFAELERKDELASASLAAIERELQRIKLTESVSLGAHNIQVIDNAQVTQNTAPTMLRLVKIFALIAAVAVAVVQYLLDPRVLALRPVMTLCSLPIIGWFPKLKQAGLEAAIPSADRLRVSVKPWLTQSKILWVTSANERDGKTLICRALAESFADSGVRAILIDADLSHPGLHMLVRESAAPGVLQLLEGESTLSDSIRPIRPGLDFIPAGGIASTLRVLSSLQMAEMLNRLSEVYDVVIVDSPAGGHDEKGFRVPESTLNVLVVARLFNTFKQSLQYVAGEIGMVPVNEVGLVVNGVDPKSAAKQLSRTNAGASGSSAPAAPERQPVAASVGAAEPGASQAEW